jgi:hypothetical protein
MKSISFRCEFCGLKCIELIATDTAIADLDVGDIIKIGALDHLAQTPACALRALACKAKDHGEAQT